MADENIKDFAVNWVLFGFLFFSLLTFSITFVFYNNPTALGDSQSGFESSRGGIQNSLIEIEGTINSDLNTSAVLSSEETSLGSQAAASGGYNLFGTGKSNWKNTKGFIALIFSGLAGEIIISVFGGVIGIIGSFYVIRLIRSIF